jgi:hypothetical protein
VAARRAHNPKVVSSNLTRATKPRLGFDVHLGLYVGGALLLAVAGCGEQAVDTTTNPPYASPALSAPAAVASRSCDTVRAGSSPSGIAAAKVLLIRQGTNLQRVSDTLSGAVPGGNFNVDAALALRNASDLRDGLAGSNICEPTRGLLVAKAQALRDTDQALVATAGGPGAAEALRASQDAYKALTDLVQNPPAS